MKPQKWAQPSADPRGRLIRFVDGLVVDPASCPHGIHARSHYRRRSGAPDATGVNSQCACVIPDIAGRDLL